jgi:polyphosphate kinase 2 (PPK2 family)
MAKSDRIPRKAYERELARLQEEFVKMAQWVKDSGTRLVVIFEGRDAAGKGGTIKRITEFLNPRIARIVALPVPTERQKTEWYWFSVSDEEQARRFAARIDDPMRRWKLSPTDLYSRTRWVDYSRAKDEMFVHTDIPEAPWYVVPADYKRRARINCMAHLLSLVPYAPRRPERIKLPERQTDEGYVRPSREIYTYVPDHAATVLG